MSRFGKLTIKGAEYVEDDSGEWVYHVQNPHALIQAAGYLKHIAEPYERVFYRGQSKLHGSLKPSLYRDIKDRKKEDKKHEKLNKIISTFNESASIFDNIPPYAVEPLLQHYGIKTSWIDLVDNIWVAIWFSVYQCHSFGKASQFIHFEQRSPKEGKFGYILCVAVDENMNLSPRKGTIRGDHTELVDLRIAVPSVFLRPHAQHGLLFRDKGSNGSREIDYSKYIKGIVRYSLSDAISWLGKGIIHDVRALFPPPFYDNGYAILLGCKLSDNSLGCIQHIGA
ncbi:UNVERIFIED_ORG: hypothetical protein ABID33_003568 [Xanthobacter viscosus]|jgi:hypothetical protein|uniref:FRG domain-containing protein n=1 Tax=Xanthobacter autotrophicus TaxID=280 RepID=A0A6C1KCR8_XANAU|nr:FRG domain-containing protein [Xanthobacter autotrophicus]TLX42059.1 FRG domain-containing protein [Xanthobacter autotrophicus]